MSTPDYAKFGRLVQQKLAGPGEWDGADLLAEFADVAKALGISLDRPDVAIEPARQIFWDPNRFIVPLVWGDVGDESELRQLLMEMADPVGTPVFTVNEMRADPSTAGPQEPGVCRVLFLDAANLRRAAECFDGRVDVVIAVVRSGYHPLVRDLDERTPIARLFNLPPERCAFFYDGAGRDQVHEPLLDWLEGDSYRWQVSTRSRPASPREVRSALESLPPDTTWRFQLDPSGAVLMTVDVSGSPIISRLRASGPASLLENLW